MFATFAMCATFAMGVMFVMGVMFAMGVTFAFGSGQPIARGRTPWGGVCKRFIPARISNSSAEGIREV
jgi:hypothetical protein